ncbi:MAG: TonB-dependent receptor [Saprospiraceae bacterium]|nr:TonB-dependent receptor [Lewinella sp.]
MEQKAVTIIPRLYRVSFFLLFMAIGTLLSAQVSGLVSDEGNGDPLIGATVLVKGTSTGTVTDFDGKYTINATPGDVLVFSYTGFATQEITVGSETVIDISMSEGVALGEVIVTGYAVESKRQTTGAISTVKAADLKAIPSGNVEQQLQGRVSGVTVISNGQPGTTSMIRVRGFGAFDGNEPLYIVDGVPVGSTDFLSPDDIETSTVLKDAAAASIYGARAANGVIVYTTKQGSKGAKKLTVTYDGLFGVTDPNVNGAPKMLSPQEQADWTHVAYRNNAAANGTEPAYNHPQYGTQAQATLPDYLYANGQNGVRGSIDLEAIRRAYEADPENVFLIKPNVNGTNWYDEITRMAPLNRHSLGFSGGTESGRYYFGLSLQDQAGILIENNFKRYSFRANSEFELTPWLSIGENLQFTYRSVTGQAGDNGGQGIADDESQVLAAYRMPSVIPVFDEFGSYASTKAAGFNNPRNPVRTLQRNNSNDGNFNGNAFGNIYLQIEPIKDLKIRTSIGGQYNNYYFKNYNYRYLGDSEPEASNSFSEGSGYRFNWVFTNTASYKFQTGAHTFTALAGIEALNTGIGRDISGSGINPFSMDLNFVNLTNVQSPVVSSGIGSQVKFYSTFGSLDYNFNEKYYIRGLVRRDGSSRFGANNRYGVFPAFSAAWRVTAEPFMQNASWIYDLKIRGGWGQMGNSNNVDPFNQYSLFGSDRGFSYYPIQGQNSGADSGFARTRIGNPDAKWETSEMTNIGFDISLFNNRWEFIMDLWRKDTKDLLFQLPIVGTIGTRASAPSVNIATMRNQGIDFQLVNRGKVSGDLRYEVTLNGAFLDNEIVYLAPGLDVITSINPGFRGIFPIRNQVGQPMSSFFGYNMIGYFKDAADVANSPTQEGAGVGRFKYEDINGDGAITPDDRTFIGSPIPDFTGGINLNLTYKGFGLDMYWYTSIGNEIWNQSKWFTDFFGSFEGSGKGERAKQSWTPELGDNALAPIWESASNLSTNAGANSWYVEDGTYLRLQQLALSYTFSSDVVSKFGLGSLNIGIAGNNLATFTNYLGLDPQVGGAADTNFGIDVGNYPVTPSYTIRLGASF